MKFIHELIRMSRLIPFGTFHQFRFALLPRLSLKYSTGKYIFRLNFGRTNRYLNFQ